MLDKFYSSIKDHIHFMHKPVKFRYTEFHLHDYYEIYFFISGNAKYFIEKNVYSLMPGDLIVTNDDELHKSVVTPGQIYDVISLQIDPVIINSISSAKYNLTGCFVNRPLGQNNKIYLDTNTSSIVTELFHKIEETYDSEHNGFEILLIAYIMELLVILNDNFNGDCNSDMNKKLPDKLKSILDYIEFNLNKDLSLEELELKFDINRYYLARLFKKHTNSTLHEYILFKRLTMAKKALQKGKSVTDACQISGFNDYFHFIRIFKKYVGTSPGKFKKSYFDNSKQI